MKAVTASVVFDPAQTSCQALAEPSLYFWSMDAVILALMEAACTDHDVVAATAPYDKHAYKIRTNSMQTGPISALRLYDSLLWHYAAVFKTKANIRWFCTDIADQISRALRHMRREFQVNFRDASVGFVVTFSFERRLATQEFVAKHAQTPQINLLVVRLAFNHLRRQVVKCATKRRTSKIHNRTLKKYIIF